MFICVLFVSLYSSIRAEISWKQKLANATNDGICGLLTYCPSEKEELEDDDDSGVYMDFEDENMRASDPFCKQKEDKDNYKNIFPYLLRIPLAMDLHNVIDYAVTKNNITQTSKNL